MAKPTFSVDNILGHKATTVVGAVLAVVPVVMVPHLDLATVLGSAAIAICFALIGIENTK